VPRLGVLGGTFDPIHHGHLLQASEVASAFALDEVLFIPAGTPWQKGHRPVSPAADRFAMTAIATAGAPAFRASRVEVDRSGPSYTVDTVEELRRRRGPGAELFLIVGADSLAGIFSWRDAASLMAMARVVACSRAGYRLADPGVPGGVSMVERPGHRISSTMIRERVRAGAPIRYLVPDGVAAYIATRGLYSRGAAAVAPPARAAASPVSPASELATLATTAPRLAIRRDASAVADPRSSHSVGAPAVAVRSSAAQSATSHAPDQPHTSSPWSPSTQSSSRSTSGW
jgi:nicotinate-nucleotide adenylyltransferase